MHAQGKWSFVLVVTAACVGACVARAAAQEGPPVPEPHEEHSTPAPEVQQLPLPLQELPLPNDEPAGPLAEAEALEPSPESLGQAIGNDEVREMVHAQFSDGTILAVIAANPTRFDVSPRALVVLKSTGVSETVIEAMLSAETANQQAAVAATENEPDGAADAEADAALPSEEFAKLAGMIERLATQQEAAALARREPDPPTRAEPGPHVRIVGPADQTSLAPTIAQVAFVEQGRGRRFETLQGLAGKALAFASPGVSGIATTLGSLFVADEKRTAVWALTNPSAGRELGAGTVFEVEFAHIPGVDPDRYTPAIVRLVPTNDNYRLVAAAEIEGATAGSLPSEPIVEELVATKLTRLGRGHYRVVAGHALGAGEYALVLRPIMQERRRRRDTEASLGELLGGGTSEILYLTWDFSVAATSK